MARDSEKGTKKNKGKGVASSSQGQDEPLAHKSALNNGKVPREFRVSRHETPAESKADHEAEIDQTVEEASQAENEDEEVEPHQEKKRLRRSGTLPCYTILLKQMRNIGWPSMRFPNRASLQQFGILEDVRVLLSNMGMESLLDMAYPVQKEVSFQFLASFDLVHHNQRDEVEGYGYITFMIRGKAHRIDSQDLIPSLGFVMIGSHTCLLLQR